MHSSDAVARECRVTEDGRESTRSLYHGHLPQSCVRCHVLAQKTRFPGWPRRRFARARRCCSGEAHRAGADTLLVAAERSDVGVHVHVRPLYNAALVVWTTSERRRGLVAQLVPGRAPLRGRRVDCPNVELPGKLPGNCHNCCITLISLDSAAWCGPRTERRTRTARRNALAESGTWSGTKLCQVQ